MFALVASFAWDWAQEVDLEIDDVTNMISPYLLLWLFDPTTQDTQMRLNGNTKRSCRNLNSIATGTAGPEVKAAQDAVMQVLHAIHPVCLIGLIQYPSF